MQQSLFLQRKHDLDAPASHKRMQVTPQHPNNRPKEVVVSPGFSLRQIPSWAAAGCGMEWECETEESSPGESLYNFSENISSFEEYVDMAEENFCNSLQTGTADATFHFSSAC